MKVVVFYERKGPETREGKRTIKVERLLGVRSWICNYKGSQEVLGEKKNEIGEPYFFVEVGNRFLVTRDLVT